jgi:hypothetical protein
MAVLLAIVLTRLHLLLLADPSDDTKKCATSLRLQV